MLSQIGAHIVVVHDLEHIAACCVLLDTTDWSAGACLGYLTKAGGMVDIGVCGLLDSMIFACKSRHEYKKGC